MIESHILDKSGFICQYKLMLFQENLAPSECGGRYQWETCTYSVSKEDWIYLPQLQRILLKVWCCWLFSMIDIPSRCTILAITEATMTVVFYQSQKWVKYLKQMG